jgi:hypothetical protein
MPHESHVYSAVWDASKRFAGRAFCDGVVCSYLPGAGRSRRGPASGFRDDPTLARCSAAGDAAWSGAREKSRTPRFFEDLARQLRAERGPNGEPSTNDFQVFELIRVVDRLAVDFDELPRLIPRA